MMKMMVGDGGDDVIDDGDVTGDDGDIMVMAIIMMENDEQ